MLCNFGYNVEQCFSCRYGNKPHFPDDYEGWSDSVIRDTMVNHSQSPDEEHHGPCISKTDMSNNSTTIKMLNELN